MAINDLKHMYKLIKRTRELVTKGKRDLRSEDFKLLDLKELFNRHILAKYEDSNFKINLDCPDGTKAILDEISFMEAIDNIINNATEHGFKNRAGGNEIFFWIDDLDNEIIIDYANNGSQFPSDIKEDEFFEFEFKEISSNGTGLGGAFVKLMLDAHNAKFEIIRKKAKKRKPIEDRWDLKHGVYFRFRIPQGRRDEQKN